jgi:hypothetical protein
VVVYAVFAAVWILGSDLLTPTIADPSLQATVWRMEGWVFVAVTSLLLSWMLLRLTRRLKAAARRESTIDRERERQASLLAALAEGSTDAMFAKDLEGR